MNRHVLLDRIMLSAIRRFGVPFFTESTDSPPFEVHLENVVLDQVVISGPGYHEVEARTLAGPVKEQFHVVHYTHPGARLLVYIMGGSETPFDRTIKKVYPLSRPVDFNVVAVEAPWQRTVKELAAAFVHLNTYMAMIATAVKMAEHILSNPAFEGARSTIVSGTSLGGFVTNRHHMAYDSADGYVPFVAGTRHGDIFLDTIAASAEARARPDHIRARLNFDQAWQQRPHSNVFPQLSRFDQLNRFEVQGPSYGNMPIDVWQGGHLYNVLHPAKMRVKYDQVFAILEERRIVQNVTQRIQGGP